MAPPSPRRSHGRWRRSAASRCSTGPRPRPEHQPAGSSSAHAMRILVYGAGAVGGFFGGLLAHAGADVHFVARGTQLDALRSAGLTIESTQLGRISIPAVSVASSARESGIADLVLVCVKTHQLAAAFDDLSSAITSGTIIVPLQNGVEADEQLSARFPR